MRLNLATTRGVFTPAIFSLRNRPHKFINAEGVASNLLELMIEDICGYIAGVKLFYTGPVVNAEMLVMMLEKHGIAATQAFVDPAAPDDGDLSRPAQVLVPEPDYDRARQLFYTEREDEL